MSDHLYTYGEADAENEWTEENLSLLPYQRVDVSIITVLAWVATVTLQRRFRDHAGTWGSWRDVESWSGDVETAYVAGRTQQIRLGVKTGDYTSGTVGLEIGRA